MQDASGCYRYILYMPTLSERFSTALHQSARVWKLALDKRLRHLGLSQTGWTTVATVAKADTPLSQAELAQAVGIESATMVATLDRLEEAGLLLRQPSPTDRRIKQVVLTSAGETLYAEVRAQASAFREELLAGVDRDTLLKATELLEHLRDVADAARGNCE